MQTDYHQKMTKHVTNVIERLKKKSKNKDLKEIDADQLIEEIKKEKGSLGSLIIKESKNQPNLKKESSSQFISVFDIMLKAYQIAASQKCSYVGTEHLVYAYFAMLKKIKVGFKKKTLSQADLSENKDLPPLPDFFRDLNSFLGNLLPGSMEKRNSKESLGYLKNFCVDLTKEITSETYTFIGREKQLERVSNILGRKNKNNPVLIGPPGVGKTAIVEGLALAINQKKAPFFLTSKKIYSLDLGLLVAGTNFRGEFESRLKDVVSIVKKNKDIILFIDEIHNLVGAGNAIGGMDAANLLKPALSRGEIQVIGATTITEYRKHIEKDAALERRFQPIIVDEPTEKETLKILTGIRTHYEKFHNLKITDEALASSIELAKRFVGDRFLPDSAIDLIDETAARIRGKSSKSALYEKLFAKEKELETIYQEKENAILLESYENALKLRNREKELQVQLDFLKKKLIAEQEKKLISVSTSDIRHTIANATGVPEELIQVSPRNIPARVAESLKKEVFGQDEAIRQIHATLLRSFSGISSTNRPLGSFLFIGPSGVGKTLTAKILSRATSPLGKENLIQINMSELSERHSISRLIGSPAGYVGYEEGSFLAEKIKVNPYSLILFDELEKADPAIINLLLQILEEGKITDAKGNTMNFRNSIIVMTSNIGTNRLNEVSRIGFEAGFKKAQKEKRQAFKEIQEQLEEIFPAELLGRIDNKIFFNNLDDKQLKLIALAELKKLANRLAERKIKFNFNQTVVNFIVKKSISSNEGARLIRTNIQQLIEPLLAQEIVKNETLKKIDLTFEKNQLKISTN